jgi:hypothetical protein
MRWVAFPSVTAAMRNIATLLIFALFATFVTIGSTMAQTISTLTAAQAERAFSDAGYSPKIVKDKAGGKLTFQGTIKSSKGSKIKFFVRTRGCKGTPAACENFIFFANFKL